MAHRRKASTEAPDLPAASLDPRVATAIYEFLLYNNDADTAAKFKPKLPDGLQDENIELLEKISSLSNLKRDVEAEGVSALEKCVEGFDHVMAQLGRPDSATQAALTELRVQCVLFHLSSGTGSIKTASKEAKKKLSKHFPKGGSAQAGSKELTVRPQPPPPCVASSCTQP